MIKKSFAILIVCLTGILFTAGAGLAASGLEVSVHPDTIRIGASYNGGQVSVSGKIPADQDVLIRVRGKSEDYKLKEKGRALGVLWMNMDSVEISNVPALFLLYLPAGPDDAGRLNRSAPWPPAALGLESVRKEVDIVAQDEQVGDLFDEFVKLKQKSGLYGIRKDVITYGPAQGAMKPFKAVLDLPAALPQGIFKIEVFTIRNGVVQNAVTRPIEAREVGMPAWIAKMAFQHGTLYGVMAVVTAILAGLLTGVMFKGEKGAH